MEHTCLFGALLFFVKYDCAPKTANFTPSDENDYYISLVTDNSVINALKITHIQTQYYSNDTNRDANTDSITVTFSSNL